MFEEVEEGIKEIIKIVELCPDKYQEKCFEVLLSAFIKNCSDQDPVKGDSEFLAEVEKDGAEDFSGQEEITKTDLHVKAKKLLEQGVTLEDINNMFYKEGDELKPLFDDLKSSKMSESQLKLALVEALKNVILTGEYKFNTDEVKRQCEDHKCYDSANYAAIFKKQKNWFNEDYARNTFMTLSADGKKELITVIKQLSS